MPSIIDVLTVIIYVLQVASIVAVIFLERQEPVTTLSWVLVLSFLPIVGFILYIFLGRGLKFYVNRKLRIRKELQRGLQSDTFRGQRELYLIPSHSKTERYPFHDPLMHHYSGLIVANHSYSDAIYSQNNMLKIYTDAAEKYSDLFREIDAAKDSIHLIYFIISNNNAGHELVERLTRKAKQGVTVRLIYDELGSITTPRHMFRSLVEAGGEVYRFFPLKLGSLLHANYRNHHKIVVIDGKIAYTGGMNVGDEYLGLHHRKTPWRDTHMRITGSAVETLQFTFLMDLFYASNNRALIESCLTSRYFPMPVQAKGIGMQMVSSGPDDNNEAIKRGFVKMISYAQKTLYIQSPYLMPDEPVKEAIQTAVASGVEVILMLPGIPDKRTVYYVTYSYIQTMLDYGVKVYMYDGFLHAKMMVIDDTICTIGTTNMDMRSFRLHFELNNFIYDSTVARQCGDIFREDLKHCTEMTPERYAARGKFQMFKESLLRLLAPMM